jgi:hypothetical protein
MPDKSANEQWDSAGRSLLLNPRHLARVIASTRRGSTNGTTPFPNVADCSRDSFLVVKPSCFSFQRVGSPD